MTGGRARASEWRTAQPQRGAARDERSLPRVLVAIANHGTKNRQFLEVLLVEYRSMDFDVDVVVFSDTPKELGDDVEVRVGAPTSDPWSLPFAHRQVFAERADDYDLFVYSEDDTHLTQRHLEAFLAVEPLLPEDEVAGFLRYELDGSGRRSYSSIHSNYRWLPESVARRGDEVFASFTNAHSACYVLTRPQLRRAIDAGGYLVAPHRGEYDMLVSAATDPYTRCGLRRRICVSRVDDFLVHHLPNAYLGRMGIDETEFRAQIVALLDIAAGTRTSRSLLNGRSRLPTSTWDVPAHPTDAASLSRAVSRPYERALTVGATSGAVERALLGPGCAITAVPLDEVLAAVARTRGLVTTSPELTAALDELEGQRFPFVLLHQMLHHAEDPTRLLRALRTLLEPDGELLATVPNFAFHRTKERLRRPVPPLPRRGHALDGIHPSDGHHVRRWFREAGFATPTIRYHTEGRAAFLARLAPSRFGATILATAGREDGPTVGVPQVPALADGRLPDLVSVVIPAYDAADVLGRQLEALACQTYEGAWEVIVADNGSSDETAAVATSFADRLPELRVVDASDRRGASHARNVGSEGARGDALAYLDADDVACDGWLAAVAEALRTADFVAGVDAPLGEPAGEATDAALTTLPPGSGTLRFLPWARAGNCAVRTIAYKEVAGWGVHSYPHGGEDIDFSWRVQLAGYPLASAPGAAVRYRHRSHLGALARQRFAFGYTAPLLYRDFRAHGARRAGPQEVARRWAWLVTRLPYLALSPPLRRRWVGMAASAAGRVWGSIRAGVVCL